MQTIEYVIGTLAIQLPFLFVLILNQYKFRRDIISMKIYLRLVLEKMNIKYFEEKT